ncbi:DUF397 domain-containing protein [Kitasatospora sp. NPDC093558]|uniref:DUF397 domain-containing protein n=1 Tax=Kitasatospora sp. NPDC093558 TaxID=3155201 RepID=UPI003425D3B7
MPKVSWQKSSFSGGDDGSMCLELASSTDEVRYLRESNDPEIVITTSTAKLRTLILGAKTGEFDHLVQPGGIFRS